MPATRRPSEQGIPESKEIVSQGPRYQQYEKNIRQDYAHQTSHALVVRDDYDLYGFEVLAIPNMTKHPKAKTDAQGQFLPNKATAKRLTQAEFACQRCGHPNNANHNAAVVIAKRGYQKTSFRRSAHEISQNHVDFSAARAETVRSHAWGDQCKPSGANGLGAAIKEPGSFGGDPDPPTSTPSG